MDLMRQGQQNRRGRGRNNNHQHRRGGQNPLTRTFESAGPDTKIRGTPAHIAEKYMALARDAQSSGDPVLAENYLQHAEHYNRIILAYREQQMQSGEFSGGSQPSIARFRPGPQDPMGGDDMDGEGDEFASEGGASQPQQQPVMRPNEPQPSIFEGGAPRESRNEPREMRDGQREGQRFEDRPQRHERHEHRPRHNGERNYQHDRRERFERSDRPDRGDRPERGERPDRGDRPERGEPRFERSGDGPSEMRRPHRASQPPAAHEQPEFLRRPVRRPRREDSDDQPAAAQPSAVPEEGRD
jgi:hypothetical protein